LEHDHSWYQSKWKIWGGFGVQWSKITVVLGLAANSDSQHQADDSLPTIMMRLRIL